MSLWVYTPNVVSRAQARKLFDALKTQVDPVPKKNVVYGRVHDEPRLTNFFSRDGHGWAYSGLSVVSKGWPEEIEQLAKIAFERTGEEYDSALLNYYRDGNDGVGKHVDKDAMFGAIASFSLGATRDFVIRDRESGAVVATIPLEDASLVVMLPGFQQKYTHEVPRRKRVTGGRVNVTLRQQALNARMAGQGKRGGQRSIPRPVLPPREVVTSEATKMAVAPTALSAVPTREALAMRNSAVATHPATPLVAVPSSTAARCVATPLQRPATTTASVSRYFADSRPTVADSRHNVDVAVAPVSARPTGQSYERAYTMELEVWRDDRRPPNGALVRAEAAAGLCDTRETAEDVLRALDALGGGIWDDEGEEESGPMRKRRRLDESTC